METDNLGRVHFMEDRKEIARTNVYLELAKEHYAWDRHHDAQRANVCTIIMVLSGVLLSIAELSIKSSFDVAIIGLVIIFSGLFGIAFVYKQYERMKYHGAKYQHYRDLVGSCLDIDFSNEDKAIAGDESYSNIRTIHKKYNLHRYWFILMAMISLIGVYVLWSALKG